MSLIVQIDCFNGFHYVARNCYGYEQLQSYIDRYETEYLCLMLDEPLRTEFINDLVDGVPQNPDYLEWFNPFCEELDQCCHTKKYISKGVKDSLTGFIYYHFVKDTQTQNTPTGTTVTVKTNSENTNFINTERVAEQRYNDSIESFQSIRKKIGYCNEVLDYKFLDII